MTKWNNSKTNYLKENYTNKSVDELAKILEVSRWTIFDRAKELGLKKNFSWTKEKIQKLKEFYPLGDWDLLFKELGTTKKQCIMDKACSLGLHFPENKWSEEEITYLKDHYEKDGAKALSLALSRSIGAIRKKAMEYNLTNEGWTAQSEELLSQVYPFHSNKDLSEQYFPTKTPEAIRTKALLMGLHKSGDKNNKTYYNKEKILQDLSKISIDLGRTPLYSELSSLGLPSEKTFDRLFGGYRMACELANLPLNEDVYGQNLIIRATDNTVCLSKAELVITEYFIKKGLPYQKEVKYIDYINDIRCGTKRFDWKIGNWFIEYFGMMNHPEYKKSALEKIKICQDNDIKLIALYPKDLKNLDSKLQILLNQNP